MSGNNVPPELVNDVNEILNTLQQVSGDTDELESLLQSVIGELQDNETDLEAIEETLSQIEDSLQSVGEDQVRVDIIDEGDVATESTVSSINNLVDALENALQSVGSDEIRVNTEPSEPITTKDFLEFEVDPDNTTSDTLVAGEEYTGEWVQWEQYVGIAIALVSDQPGGVSSDGLNSLKVDFTNDPQSGPGRTLEIDYPPEQGSAGQGIQPVIPREAEYYRVRYQNGDTDQSLLRITTVKLPRDYATKVLPLEDTVEPNNTAELTKSVITAKTPDGDYKNVESNRTGDLRTETDSVGNNAYRHSPRGDVTLYGAQVTASKVPQIERQFWDDDPNTTLNTTETGSASVNKEASHARFNSGSDPNATLVAQTFKRIQYLTSSEIKSSFAAAWIQPPTSAGDYSMIGLSGGNDGFEIGYKGTQFGIRRLRAGVEENFVPQTEFNIDKLDGNPESEYERQNVPVPINHQTQDMWRIRYGWYGVAPTHVEVLAPDGHWVAVHKFDFTDEEIPQTEQPNLPVRSFIQKNSSDSTDIQQNVNAFYGGIKANVSVAQQPDGDFVSEKASGQAFKTEELLPANDTYTSEWIDSDGWESFELQILSDQVSVDGGVVVEFTDDVQSENITTAASARFTYSQELVNNQEALVAILPTELDGLRVRYQNGPIGQNSLLLTGTLRTTSAGQQTTLETPVQETDLAKTSRSIITAPDVNGDYDKVLRDDDALKINIDQADAQVETEPDNAFQTTQVSVPDEDGGGPIEVLTSPLVGRRDFRVSNDGSDSVYMGSDNTLAPDNGYQIRPQDDEEFELAEEAEVWMVAEDNTGGTTTHKLDPDAAQTNGTATNPDNVVLSDDVRAIYDAQGELVNASGYDASGAQTRDEISDVDIGFEGREAAGQLQTITHEQTTSATSLGGTSITTDGSLTANGEDFYVVSIAVRSNNISVGSVSGLGLTWTQETTASNSNGVKTELWSASGEPTSSGSVTANFNSTVITSGITASRFSGVDLDSPIESTGQTTGSGTAWTTTPSSSGAGDRIIGGAAVTSSTTNAPGADDTEHADRSIGGNANERLTVAFQSREAASPGEPTDGTWGAAGEWAASSAALNQAPEEFPVIELTYEVGAEGTGPTSLNQTVENDIDELFSTDVTGDRNWSYTDIDNITLTAEQTVDGAADAEIDHIFVRFTEADSGSTQSVTFYEGGIQ